MKIHIPALCFGDPYHSLTRSPIKDLSTCEELAELGLVLDTHIATDLGRKGLLRRARQLLQAIPIAERIKICVRAGEIFETETLEWGGGSQTLDEYHELVSRVSGLPIALVSATSKRLAKALRESEAIIAGLSRGLPLEIFDTGIGRQGGAAVSLRARFDGLAVVLPVNSPGVNVVWVILVALGLAPVIKPGSAEPATAYRLIQAFIRAGIPKECFGFYPCNHAAAANLPGYTGGAIVFGSDETVQRWANNPWVELHGSGYSKLILGEDRMGDMMSLMPELSLNTTANSGRSCYGVSLNLVPDREVEFAEALAQANSALVPLPRNDPQARLSAMANPAVAAAINAEIEAGLKQGGAVDVSAKFRKGGRLVEANGLTYLLPTTILCDSRDHPLANKEYMFPFSAVVRQSNADALARLGSTLSLAVYTHDEGLKAKARNSTARLVSVNKPTSELDRCQPHEGNVFELGFERRSYVE